MNFHLKHTLIGGVAGGAVGATIGGVRKSGRDPFNGKKVEHFTSSERKRNAVLGGLRGAVSGAATGFSVADLRRLHQGTKFRGAAGGGYEGYQRRHGGTGPKPAKVDMPDWLKGAKTKSEAKAKYRAVSRQHHPDVGGSDEKMKDINNQWSKWEGHFKEAMLAAFADELEKIAHAAR